MLKQQNSPSEPASRVAESEVKYLTSPFQNFRLLNINEMKLGC